MIIPSPSRSRFLRPRANGLKRARPPMATRGTATAAAAIPARLRPASDTADWMELLINPNYLYKLLPIKCKKSNWATGAEKEKKITGRIHQCRHLLLGEQPSSGSIRGPPSSCPARRPVAQRRLLPGRRRPAWRWPSATACRPKAWCCCWARRRTRLRSSPLERRVLHCERWPSCRIAWRLGFYASIFPVEEQEPN